MIENTSTNTLRLYDVFISGPLYLILAQYVENIYLKTFVYLVGLSAIIFNGWNFFHFQNGKFDNNLGDVNLGKTQLHRIFNLVFMYPLLFYTISITSSKIPRCLSIIMYLIVLGGFAVNLYYFVKYLS